MSEEDKKYLDDECGKIDFMSIVQGVGSQIKVSIDTEIFVSLVSVACLLTS